ncbi:transferase [Syncephalis plumigaleata]|nr:transferase [Syncephalis plumigaleata]
MTKDTAVIHVVKPTSSLPEHAVRLVDVDLYQPAVYTCPLFFYRNSSLTESFMETANLIEGLKQALNQYPILYGRLGKTNDNCMEIQPSANGIPVHETYISMDFDALAPYWRYADIPVDFSIGNFAAEHGDPLCLVKIIRFANNSGVAIAMQLHHYCADMFSIMQFARVWAAHVRGDALPPSSSVSSSVSSEQGRRLMKGHPADAPIPLLPISKEIAPHEFNETMIMHITGENLRKLKMDTQANLSDNNTGTSYAVPWISSLDALSALIIRAHLRLDESKQRRIITIPVNLRSRAPTRIPSDYFGNATIPLVIDVDREEILGQSISHLAAIIRGRINEVTEDYVDAIFNKLATVPFEWPTPETNIRIFQAHDICLTDWTKSAPYTVDFGYGVPTRFRSAGVVQGPPAAYLGMPPISTDNTRDGIEMYICIPKGQLTLFEQDDELNRYLTLVG